MQSILQDRLLLTISLVSEVHTSEIFLQMCKSEAMLQPLFGVRAQSPRLRIDLCTLVPREGRRADVVVVLF